MQTELGSHGGTSETSQAGESGADTFEGNQCLSFSISGPWGHFRRIDGNTVKTTYRIIPRTTVAGIIAAMMGLDRDSYYDLFEAESSAIAIQPTSVVRTMNLPVNNLTTSKEGLKGVNSRGKVSVYYPDPTADRQRTNYEVLVEPEYRIDISLDDTETYQTLKTTLRNGESHYTPSLGLSEYLADVNYLGEHDIDPIESAEPIDVDTAVPDPNGVVPDSDVTYATERSPGFMTRTNESGSFSGRRTTDYITYTYAPNGGTLEVSGIEAATVDGRTVVFV